MNNNLKQLIFFVSVPAKFFILFFLIFIFSSIVKAENDITEVLKNKQWNESDQEKNISDILSSIKPDASDRSVAEKGVLYFCDTEIPKDNAMHDAQTLDEFIENKKNRLQHFNNCYKSFLELYEEKSKSHEREGINAQSLTTSKSNMENLIKKNQQLIGNAEGLSISVSKVMPAIDISQQGSGVRIDLSEYFDLYTGENGENKTLLKLPLVFKFVGCDQVSSDKQELLMDLKGLTKRIEALENLQNSGSSLVCTLTNEMLEIKAKSLGSGTQSITVTASYKENGVELARRSQNFSVNVTSGGSSSGPRNCVDWSCPNHFDFLVGAEGSSMSEVKKESILRYEFASYTQISHNHFHMFGRIFQTSVASLGEKSTAPAGFDCDGAAASDVETNCDTSLIESHNALIGANIFFLKADADAANKLDWALFPIKKRALGKFDEQATKSSLLVGPSFQFGMERADNNSDSFSKNYFGGIRFAYSKLRYFDMLYGKREGLYGNRLKFKGQLPVLQDNFVAGVEVEMAADNELKNSALSNQDSVKAFVLYKVDFANFIK